MFGEGISKEGDLIDLAVNIGLISKSGAWYAYEGDKIGQGRENAKQYIKENPDFCAMLDEKVREFYFSQNEEVDEDAVENAVSEEQE